MSPGPLGGGVCVSPSPGITAARDIRDPPVTLSPWWPWDAGDNLGMLRRDKLRTAWGKLGTAWGHSQLSRVPKARLMRKEAGHGVTWGGVTRGGGGDTLRHTHTGSRPPPPHTHPHLVPSTGDTVEPRGTHAWLIATLTDACARVHTRVQRICTTHRPAHARSRPLVPLHAGIRHARACAHVDTPVVHAHAYVTQARACACALGLLHACTVHEYTCAHTLVLARKRVLTHACAVARLHHARVHTCWCYQRCAHTLVRALVLPCSTPVRTRLRPQGGTRPRLGVRPHVCTHVCAHVRAPRVCTAVPGAAPAADAR